MIKRKFTKRRTSPQVPSSVFSVRKMNNLMIKPSVKKNKI